eukprot:TRINITY_DN3301_c0_g3_i1.p1 TRINITY_DN3301_c0_g3~~TRINITY_DN3301_c0_g3_i1.p1  ORF type:complete len:275 (+),score=45.50 TRINITY_DN3301_c0_g3_i1:493-1317(+)
MGNKQSTDQSQHPEAPVQPIQEPLPTLDNSCAPDYNSLFLHETNLRFLAKSLPGKDYREAWTLLYASKKHGQSFNRFMTHTTGAGPTLIIIRDDGGHVFGGFASETWKDAYPKFYGNSSSFVFQIHPETKIYHPTGINQNFQYLNHDTKTLYNGVGQGGAIDFFCWGIGEDFEAGQTRGTPNTTFGCHPLGHASEWRLDCMEVWEVKAPENLTYEQEMIRKKKGGITKSVLNSENNPDKAITAMMGHEFSVHGEEVFNDEDKDKGKKSYIPSVG